MAMEILWILQMKYSPHFIFPVIYQDSPIFWQIKLDHAIEVIIRDEILYYACYLYTVNAATLGKPSWTTSSKEARGQQFSLSPCFLR